MHGKLLLPAAALLFLSAAGAGAFETYNGCAPCHPDFGFNETTHDLHIRLMATECALCHPANPGSKPVGTEGSRGTPFNEGLGCSGCHTGEGLRRHHVGTGAADCLSAGCHVDGDEPRENIPPPYYGTPDTRADNPCNPVAATGFNENFDGDLTGLDNDGDLLYDLDDPDCHPPVPDIKINGSDGPVPVPAGTALTVTVSLDCAGAKGRRADFWAVARTGLPPPRNLFHYDGTRDRWLPGRGVSFQGPCAAVIDRTILSRKLPAGTYRFLWGLDLQPNGEVDGETIARDAAGATVVP